MERSEKVENTKELPRVYQLTLSTHELGLVMLMQNFFAACISGDQDTLDRMLDLVDEIRFKQGVDFQSLYMSIGNKIGKLVGHDFKNNKLNAIDFFKG